MEILKQIDQLILNLTKLKPHIATKNSEVAENFSNQLHSSIEKLSGLTSEHGLPQKSENASGHIIPTWVDKNYHFDPSNPRKPNTREVMKAISGKTFEELQSGDQKTFSYYSELSIELVFGVLGKTPDTRDWNKIMSADNILEAIRKETGEVLGTKVDIDTKTDINGQVINQFAVVKNKENNVLRSLMGEANVVVDTLTNFGVSKSNIPQTLKDKITSPKFDTNIINAIEVYRDYNPKFAETQSEPLENDKEKDINALEHTLIATAAQQVIVQSASEVIANKISKEIPLDELAKL